MDSWEVGEMGGPVSFVRSEVDVRFIGENPWTCVGYDPLCDPYHRGGSLLQRVCELHPGVENLPPSLVDRTHPRAENLPPTVQRSTELEVKLRNPLHFSPRRCMET